MFGWAVRGPDPARVPATRDVVTANPATVIDWGGPDAPFHLAGAGPIPPNSVLVFRMELIDVLRAEGAVQRG